MKPHLNPITLLTSKIQAVEHKLAVAIDAADRELRETVATVKARDPAARSTAEVLLLYSGVHAIMAHRVSHHLYKKGHHFSARALSQAARALTGVEIHPAATIGKGFFINARG